MRSFFCIFIFLLLDVVAFSLMLPWLPSISDHYSQSITIEPFAFFATWIYKKIQSKSAITGGLISSSLSLAQFLTAPVVGALSDVYSRKSVLIFLQLLNVASYTLNVFIGQYFLCFILTRFLCGVARTNVAVLTALLSDHTDSATRTPAMAIIGAAYSVGFTIGPPFSAIVFGRFASTGLVALRYISLLAIALQSVGLLLLYYFIPYGVNRPGRSVTSRDLLSNLLQALSPRHLFRSVNVTVTPRGGPLVQSCYWIWFIYLFIFSGLESTLMFLSRSRFNYTSQEQGYMFFFIGVVMAIVQGLLVRRFRSGNEKLLSSVAMFSIALASLTLSLAKQPWVFYLGLFLWSMAAATFMPAFQGMTSLMVKPEKLGQVTGIFRSINALARSLGPTLFALLFSILGPGLSYSIAAICLLILCKKLTTISKTDLAISTQ